MAEQRQRQQQAPAHTRPWWGTLNLKSLRCVVWLRQSGGSHVDGSLIAQVTVGWLPAAACNLQHMHSATCVPLLLGTSAQEMDAEGRVLVTDHGNFVLFNLYGAPNLTTLTRRPLRASQQVCGALRYSDNACPISNAGPISADMQARQSPLQTQLRIARSSSCASTGWAEGPPFGHIPSRKGPPRGM